MKSLFALGVLALTQAHTTFDDEVSDDILLHGKEDFLDNSGMNIEKEITKFSLLNKFSDQSSSSTRGNVIVTKNKANQEIIGVALEENVVPSAEYQ
jgi:hypothetical protein